MKDGNFETKMDSKEKAACVSFQLAATRFLGNVNDFDYHSL